MEMRSLYLPPSNLKTYQINLYTDLQSCVAVATRLSLGIWKNRPSAGKGLILRIKLSCHFSQALICLAGLRDVAYQPGQVSRGADSGDPVLAQTSASS